MCNGKGTCVCGKCTCDRDDNYRGPTCEDCPVSYSSYWSHFITSVLTSSSSSRSRSILLQPVLSWPSSFVVPIALMSRLTQSIHLCVGLPLFFSKVVPSAVVVVSSLYVAKPPQSCFPAPLCDVLYLQSLSGVIISHTVS